MSPGRGRRRRPKRLGLAKGYDSDPLRAALRQHGLIPLASYRTKRGPQPGVQAAHERKHKRSCRQRWKVDRSFAWINRFRRLDRFLERSQKSYRAFVRVFFINPYLDRFFQGSGDF